MHVILRGRISAQCTFYSRCKPEQDEVHWSLADAVEVTEVVVHHVPQLVHITHLLVVLRLRFHVAEVAEDEAAQVVLGHVTAAVAILAGQVRKQLIEVLVQLIVGDVAHVREQPSAVSVVHKTVVEHTQHLHGHDINVYKVKVRFTYIAPQTAYVLLAAWLSG